MKITITKKLSKKISKALKGFMSVLLILSLYTCASEPAKPKKSLKIKPLSRVLIYLLKDTIPDN